MVNKYTAVFEQDEDWWIGYVEELPGANTQGATLEEARNNLQEAIQLVAEANHACKAVVVETVGKTDLAAAAEKLLSDYDADDELTAFTALDGDDFCRESEWASGILTIGNRRLR